ncbi:MAG: zinc metallopeptidase [Lachnospiraceae bacterium]|nr:zinc metallopeptidase [Lachnospiraceae bacterium]
MFISFEYIIILIPAMILAFYAQSKVDKAYNKYSKVMARSGLTGHEVAQRLLDANGVTDVKIGRVGGKLSDNYSPEQKLLNLSDGVRESSSLAALGIAAHETGHALQHARKYVPLTFRNMMVFPTMVTSKLAIPIIILGIILTSFIGEGALVIATVGIIFFALSVVFALITLPVEFNASKRAIDLLESNHIIDSDEVPAVKEVLNAAALTYVASAAAAIATLLRLILIVRRRNN